MDPNAAKETEKNCVLCCQEVDIFALGKCDHPVCYRCSTKMRVLCDQKYCAVCREELDKVRTLWLLWPGDAAVGASCRPRRCGSCFVVKT